jgi:hypothetical protein
MRQTFRKVVVIIGHIMVMAFFACGGSPGSDESAVTCGNGVCEQSEDMILLTQPVQFRCAQDCPGVCGDSICNSCFENKDNCPQDCGE